MMQVVNTMPETDAELLLELKEGSRAAFDILYNKYWKKVYNTAYKRLNDKEMAEDIAQDIFVQLWTRGTEDLIVDLEAYFFISTRNGVFKYMGREDRYTELSEDVYKDIAASLGADGNMMHKEFLAMFEQLVDALPDQQRTIFRLRFVESLSSSEIAEKLNISPKTVRNHMGKALATLKSELFLSQLLILVSQFRNHK